jgi:propanediol dehydratase small subunit
MAQDELKRAVLEVLDDIKAVRKEHPEMSFEQIVKIMRIQGETVTVRVELPAGYVAAMEEILALEGDRIEGYQDKTVAAFIKTAVEVSLRADLEGMDDREGAEKIVKENCLQHLFGSGSLARV